MAKKTKATTKPTTSTITTTPTWTVKVTPPERSSKRYIRIDFQLWKEDADGAPIKRLCRNKLEYDHLDKGQALVIELKLIDFLESLNDYGFEELKAGQC